MIHNEKKLPKAERRPLKYLDKSEGQEQVLPVFDNIKRLLKSYERNNFKPRDEHPGSYGLYCIAPIEIAGKKFNEICFASLLIQKGYVGFYFFPIYLNPVLAKQLKPALMKCLKGKTCFHIKKDDEGLLIEIGEALETGFDFYTNQGWVKK